MSELLTARDIELKSFKKVSFGGYAIQEVEDFLNQVADDLEAYVLRIDERDAKIHDLEEYVRKQESMTDMIKNALIQAQKAAKDMEEQANEQKAKILSQARIEAENKLEEAKEQAADITARARISADNIIKEAEELKAETQRRWENLERDLDIRKHEVSQETDRMLDAAQSEADRMLDEASRQVEEYVNKLKVLNLQKQQFLQDTASLLINFGRTINNAQQELENEMNSTPSVEVQNENFMERFQKNLLEGAEHEREREYEHERGDNS
ncbi:MAG: DivIVA domain-containing protein [Synergistaceae bacterium]|nr:DivIVA domain-containing protein [Synergistaceae bacterium]